MTARNQLTLSLCLTLSILIILLIAGPTAQGQKVETAYDKAADFAQYKTYAWAKRDVPPPNPLLAVLIANNIEVELKEKGLRKVGNNDDPDLLVSCYGGTSVQSAFAADDPGFAASGGAPISGATMGAGSTTLDAMPQLLKGALVVDLVDARQQHVVWRAVAKTNLDYEKRSKMIDQVNKAVAAMFKKYPPQP